jgi:hypothetical protein
MKLWNKFVEEVTHHFRFLETDFGFARKPAKPPFVIYESDKLQLLVYYDVNGRHELDVGLRRLGDDPRKVSSVGLTEMMLLADRELAEKSQAPFPSTEESLEAEVKRLAELLKKYGSAFLKCDEHVFDQVDRLEREREKEMAAPAQHVNSLKK